MPNPDEVQKIYLNTNNTATEIAKARLTVCGLADNKDDARVVLESLGLIAYTPVKRQRRH